jgi:hypothetical protein
MQVLEQKPKHVRVILEPFGRRTADDFLLVASGRYVQVCRARVLTADFAKHLLLVFAYTDETSDITLESVAVALSNEAPKTEVVLVTESKEGRAAAIIDSGGEDQISHVAGAVAVMQVSWGWDESPIIIVRVNDTVQYVSPRYDGRHWNAFVSCDPSYITG